MIPSEVRYVEGLQVREAQADGDILEAVVTTYNNWVDVGPFMERMAPGVFDATLSRHADSVKLVVGHDDSVPGVATPVEWRKADDHLAVVYRFGSHQEARAAAQMAREGMFGGLSVGFLPGKRDGASVWELDGAVKRVTRHEARLLHLGLVTTPANADAAYAMRSLGAPGDIPRPRMDAARAVLERFQADRWE